MDVEEPQLSVREVARRFPGCRGAKHLNEGTVGRWITFGVLGPTGKRVRLHANRIGGRWFTTPTALEAFAAALNPVPQSAPETPN